MKTRLLLLLTSLLLMSAETERSKQFGAALLSAENRSSSFEILDSWSTLRVKSGIQICSRWIITSDKVKTRQLKGVTILPVRREKLSRFITDEELARKWMVFLDELHYYQVTDNPDEWYAYGRINLLGKLACFDVVTSNHLMLINQDNQTIITMNGASGYLPCKSGVHRITGLCTSWQFTSITPSQTRVEYLLYSDMNPVVPVWMTDPVVINMLVMTLTRLREKAGEPEMP